MFYQKSPTPCNSSGVVFVAFFLLLLFSFMIESVCTCSPNLSPYSHVFLSFFFLLAHCVCVCVSLGSRTSYIYIYIYTPRGCIHVVIFTWGEIVHSVCDTHIFIDLHLPRLTHLHDAMRLSHVRCVSVWMRPRSFILKSSRSPKRILAPIPKSSRSSEKVSRWSCCHGCDPTAISLQLSRANLFLTVPSCKAKANLTVGSCKANAGPRSQDQEHPLLEVFFLYTANVDHTASFSHVTVWFWGACVCSQGWCRRLAHGTSTCRSHGTSTCTSTCVALLRGLSTCTSMCMALLRAILRTSRMALLRAGRMAFLYALLAHPTSHICACSIVKCNL